MKKGRFAGSLLALALLLAAPTLPAANLVVPSLEVITRAFMNAGTFELASICDLDLVVEGGYKFGGRIGLSYTDTSLEEDDPADRLAFDGMSIIVRDVFDLPLSVSWFIGSYDVFASGSEFPASFGTAEIASAYRGYMYFPTGVPYDGIHQLKGTGIRLSSMPIPDTLLLMLYLYQDSWVYDTPFGAFETGHYSTDLRVLANLSAVKLEGFFGWSWVDIYSDAGWFRAGVLAYASVKNIEVLAEIGLPKWDPVDDPFSINLLSMLFEPRLHLGRFNVAATFFWHPGWYHQERTGELGTFDVNLHLYFGDLEKTLTQGGLEGNLGFDSTAGTFDFRLAPYFSFTTPGAIWKLKVDAKLWPFDVTDLLEGTIGIRASF